MVMKSMLRVFLLALVMVPAIVAATSPIKNLKYIRYVTFVEDQVLPGIIRDDDIFYGVDAQLKPEFQANMDRLRDFQQETLRLTTWADCLVYRLKANYTFDQTCLRANYGLDGLSIPPTDRDAS
jgi:hypothetical protein